MKKSITLKIFLKHKCRPIIITELTDKDLSDFYLQFETNHYNDLIVIGPISFKREEYRYGIAR